MFEKPKKQKFQINVMVEAMKHEIIKKFETKKPEEYYSIKKANKCMSVILSRDVASRSLSNCIGEVFTITTDKYYI